MANTVTEMIGDDYRNWKYGDVIFISSPTGSGKTYFILHQFFLCLAKYHRRMLYLVNRKILREQLENIIKNSAELCQFTEYICIKSYQEIEERDNELRRKALDEQIYGIQYDERVWDYDCVVCDECHYFLADANFNTKTDVSFQWIQDTFQYRLRIFMSATIDEIENYIRNDIEKEPYFRTDIYRFPSNRKRKISVQDCNIKRYPEFSQERDYSYVIPKIIEKDSIAEIVSNGEGKWLVFVDNIKLGRELEKEIRGLLKEKQMDESEEVKYIKDIEKAVVVVTSKYDQDEKSYEEVNKITEEEKFAAKVIIATSVMDNGITIKDTEMRNMVIIADTETKFIQMLGRKRRDEEKLNLYIVRQYKGQFEQRKKMEDSIKTTVDEYRNAFIEGVKRPLEQLPAKIESINWGTEDRVVPVIPYQNDNGELEQPQRIMVQETDQIAQWCEKIKDISQWIEKIPEMYRELSCTLKIYQVMSSVQDMSPWESQMSDIYQWMPQLSVMNQQMKKAEQLQQIQQTKQILQKMEDDVDVTIYNINEKKCCYERHIWLMDKIADYKIREEDVFRVFRIENGMFYLSRLAAKNIDNQIVYYNQILSKFETDGEDAFVKEQLRWIGITGEDANDVINEAKRSEVERCRSVIIKNIDNLFNDNEEDQEKKTPITRKTLAIQDAIDERAKIRSELRILAESLEWKEEMGGTESDFIKKQDTVVKNLKKRSNRHMSKDDMAFFNQYADIPYIIVEASPSKNIWIIEKDIKERTPLQTAE